MNVKTGDSCNMSLKEFNLNFIEVEKGDEQ